MAVISIGDGRLIEHTEGALRVPPPEPKVKKPRVPRKTKRLRKPRSIMIRGHKAKYDFRPPRKGPKPVPPDNTALRAIPGYETWRSRRAAQITALTAKGRAPGSADGMTAGQSEARWADARRKARRDMKVIEDKLDLDASAKEALFETLVVMRAPGEARLKLAAAKQVLDFTMAKPVARTELTVNAAEKWLEELAKGEAE